MLRGKPAIATAAVKDVAAAARFYDEVLGLERGPSEEESGLSYRTGASSLLVYPSQYAGTNQATTVTGAVGDELEEIVRGLAAKGVTFERYDLPGLTREGDIHEGGGVKLAWFKDPDGNIHHLYGG